MGSSDRLVRIYKDGTVKHRNLFTGLEAWAIPGRSRRPNSQTTAAGESNITEKTGIRELCDFCPACYLKTPPEKARLVRRKSRFVVKERVPASELFSEDAEFRRISNLFEILTLDYWEKNHGFSAPEETAGWQAEYLDSDDGFSHVKSVLSTKLTLMGWDRNDIRALTKKKIARLSAPFFAGSHDLIVARRHLAEGAATTGELCAPGRLSPDEHAAFIGFAIDACSQVKKQNPHLKHAALFQNWLKPAGASFDHLHKQLVGMDETGPLLRRKLDICSKSNEAFKLFFSAALKEGLAIAANRHAAAFADTGQPYPAVIIVSFSRANTLGRMEPEEVRAFSDLLHACHAAWDQGVPANEEWSFAPEGVSARMPVHAVIKWRMNTAAGFEGLSGIHINPMAPHEVRDAACVELESLDRENRLAPLDIGKKASISAECLEAVS